MASGSAIDPKRRRKDPLWDQTAYRRQMYRHFLQDMETIAACATPLGEQVDEGKTNIDVENVRKRISDILDHQQVSIHARNGISDKNMPNKWLGDLIQIPEKTIVHSGLLDKPSDNETFKATADAICHPKDSSFPITARDAFLFAREVKKIARGENIGFPRDSWSDAQIFLDDVEADVFKEPDTNMSGDGGAPSRLDICLWLRPLKRSKRRRCLWHWTLVNGKYQLAWLRFEDDRGSSDLVQNRFQAELGLLAWRYYCGLKAKDGKPRPLNQTLEVLAMWVASSLHVGLKPCALCGRFIEELGGGPVPSLVVNFTSPGLGCHIGCLMTAANYEMPMQLQASFCNDFPPQEHHGGAAGA